MVIIAFHPKSLYELLCEEIDADFDILNEKSRNQLKLMIKKMAEDAYDRGMKSKRGE